MRKFICLLLVLVCVLGFTGCGKESESNTNAYSNLIEIIMDMQKDSKYNDEIIIEGTYYTSDFARPGSIPQHIKLKHIILTENVLLALDIYYFYLDIDSISKFDKILWQKP